MTTELEKVEQYNKKIQAMVDSITMTNEDLKDKLSVAVIKSYLGLPDASFGWVTKGAMPPEVKMMAIAAHIQAGAMPGYGNIYFLGNKLYQSAAFVASKANSDPNFKIKGDSVFEPFTEAEMAMFGIESGDMACKVTMTIEAKGEEMRVTGHGIIGRDEIASGKPGLNNKKNRAMTLKTRAMRDLLNRYYPTEGIPVAPDVSEETEVIQAGVSDQAKMLNAQPEILKQVREDIIEAEAADHEGEKMEMATESYKALAQAAKEKGLSNKEMLKAAAIRSVKDLFGRPSGDIFERLEIMSDWVESAPELPPPGTPKEEKAEPSKLSPEIESMVEIMLDSSRISDEGKEILKALQDNPPEDLDPGKFDLVFKSAMKGDYSGIQSLVQ